MIVFSAEIIYKFLKLNGEEMFRKLIEQLKKIECQYEISTWEELFIRKISGYLNRLFAIKADKVERLEDLEGNWTELFYLSSSESDELNSELHSNLTVLQSEQF